VDAVSDIPPGSVAQEATKRESDSSTRVFAMNVNLCARLVCVKAYP
jgi:hypothetical protein